MKGAVVALGGSGGCRCSCLRQEAERGAWTTSSRSSAVRRRGEREPLQVLALSTSSTTAALGVFQNPFWRQELWSWGPRLPGSLLLHWSGVLLPVSVGWPSAEVCRRTCGNVNTLPAHGS